jgi:hypothetical protein
MSQQQSRCCEAIHEDDLAKGDKTEGEYKLRCLLADGSASGISMLDDVNLRRNVE